MAQCRSLAGQGWLQVGIHPDNRRDRPGGSLTTRDTREISLA